MNFLMVYVAKLLSLIVFVKTHFRCPLFIFFPLSSLSLSVKTMELWPIRHFIGEQSDLRLFGSLAPSLHSGERKTYWDNGLLRRTAWPEWNGHYSSLWRTLWMWSVSQWCHTLYRVRTFWKVLEGSGSFWKFLEVSRFVNNIKFGKKRFTGYIHTDWNWNSWKNCISDASQKQIFNLFSRQFSTFLQNGNCLIPMQMTCRRTRSRCEWNRHVTVLWSGEEGAWESRALRPPAAAPPGRDSGGARQRTYVSICPFMVVLLLLIYLSPFWSKTSKRTHHWWANTSAKYRLLCYVVLP